jgi:hypothetical protein
MRQRVLIIKEVETNIRVQKDYIQIKSFKQDLIISFLHISSIYINKSIDIGLKECYSIIQKVPLYLIDHNGYILAQLKEYENE